MTAPAIAPATPPPPQPTGPPEWRTFEHGPRFHNSYVGIRNRFALLSEAYAYATFEDRIKATNYFMEEALNFAHANVGRPSGCPRPELRWVKLRGSTP